MEGLIGRIIQKLRESFGGPHETSDTLIARPDTTKNIDGLIQDSLRVAPLKPELLNEGGEESEMGPLMRLIMAKISNDRGVV
jgi:hypothetical protein